MIKYNNFQQKIQIISRTMQNNNSPPPKYQHMSPSIPSSSQTKKHKLKLISQSPTSGQDTAHLDDELVNLAINNSYTKQIANSTAHLSTQNTIANVATFLTSFIKRESNQIQLEEFWVIVEVNEENFGQKSVSIERSKSKSLDLKKLKLYQLFIGLGGKEFRFQSLQNYKKKFIVNVDIVEVDILPPTETDELIDIRTKLIVDKQYEIEFWINPATLPFNINKVYKQEAIQQMMDATSQKTMSMMVKSIFQSKGKQYGLSASLLKESLFYETRYATQQQFSKYCESGDLILFKDNHTMAKVQRFFTNSECDHLGIIYRHEKYGLCIFESSSNIGVSLAIWNQLIRYKWYENIESIYWRRLNMQNKPSDFDSKIAEFVKVNLHKQYGFSLSKLLRFKEAVYSNEQEKNRSYFCSELVAALYKYLGLLEEGKSSSNYIPKDFTDRGSINMINNTALEAERKIIFDPHLLKEEYKFYKD